jgi:hypothetical protein
MNSRFLCPSVPRRVDHGTAGAPIRNLSFVLALLALTSAAISWSPSARAQMPPGDAKPTCAVTPAEFDGWFATGHRAAGGKVNPPDSAGFGGKGRPPDCDFHKWSERMFLWLTSPADGRGRVFESSELYAVSAPAGDHSRTLTQNADILVRGSKPIEAPGEASNRDVLMARNNSLVHYLIQVNDVYAYFLTGMKTGKITLDQPQFPFTQEELAKIVNFAGTRGIVFPHPEALVVEVKSAWIETAGLDDIGVDARKYITMMGTIPDYTKSGSSWILNGSKRAQLALVGMHIVGSVAQHPEMVWATFEHIDNAPAASYRYCKDDLCNNPITVNPQPGRTWLFSAHNCTAPKNQARMRATTDGNIEAVPPGGTIGPGDTCREQAWGTPINGATELEENTQIIAINNSIVGLLNDDVRKNYLLIGTTWSSGIGSIQLANTTLETFAQQQNCTANCHIGNRDVMLSHIYQSLSPLP